MWAAMWARSLAAALLGLPLTVSLVGLVALLWPGDLHARTLPWLLLSFPIWIGVMSLAFLAGSGWRAWAWMGGGTAACFAAIVAVKALGWVTVVP